MAGALLAPASGAGDTAIFFRSWYRRVLDDRILGARRRQGASARAFDEINEFEAQQRDYGTLIVKLYFDVRRRRPGAPGSSERQPIRGGEVQRRDDFIDVRDPAYAEALKDLRKNSDTRWSPWRMIDGNDEEQPPRCRAEGDRRRLGRRRCPPNRRSLVDEARRAA